MNVKKILKAEEKNIEKEDLNRKILRNEKSKKIARQLFFSRTVITLIALAVQLGLLLFFLINLSSRIEVYLSGSVFLSLGFMIYIANNKCKNEYKIAWIVPVVIFPLVGITCYFLYHADWGGRKLKKQVIKIDSDLDLFLPKKEDAEKILKQYPDFENLGRYIFNEGHFFPHQESSAKYYSCGEKFYPDFLEMLMSAKKFIFIEFFIIRVEESWDRILQILKKKVQEGVDVRVMCDGVGTYMVSAIDYQKYLKSLGIKAKVFSKLYPIVSTPINNRDHRKIVIVDGKYGFTGGLNLSNEYFNIGKNKFPYWKDTGVIIRGRAIVDLMRMFLEVWNINEKVKDDYADYLFLEYPPVESDGLVIPYGDHAFNGEDLAENICLDIINTAKKYLYITSPYVIVDNQILSSLAFAAKRGVDVRIVVPSRPDHIGAFCVGKTFLKDLIDDGVKIFLYKKGFTHAKGFIADGRIATVGSINMDYRSFYAHFECGALLYKSSAIADIKEDFDSMFENDCVEMKHGDYKKLPLIQRFVGRILRIFGPLM